MALKPPNPSFTGIRSSKAHTGSLECRRMLAPLTSLFYTLHEARFYLRDQAISILTTHKGNSAHNTGLSPEVWPLLASGKDNS